MSFNAVAASRTILTRLHDVMASRSAAQAKLNTVVEVIGAGLDSEVCSIYLLREGMLELFATRGLAQEAVHVTRLAVGEGLVGTIAEHIETLNLAEAAAHPDFAFRPETGEEKFHSFAGVPIVRRERAVGVLAVQHVDPRRYEEVEIEALQTVAMVLSELIANAGLVDDESYSVSFGAERNRAAARADAGQGARGRHRGLPPAARHHRTRRRRRYRGRAPARLSRVRPDARADRPDGQPGRIRRRRRA